MRYNEIKPGIMKHFIIFLFSFLLFNTGIKANIPEESARTTSGSNPINIYCSPDLYKLTSSWANEYCRLNPGTEIKVINAPAKSMEKNKGGNFLGIITGNYPEMYEGMQWNMVLGRDIIIPVYNDKNPLSDEISRKGITPQGLEGLLKGRKTWGDILNNNVKTMVSLYVDGNRLEQKDFPVLSAITDDPGYVVKTDGITNMITSVDHDPSSIGICNITELTSLGAQIKSGNIRLLPIDRNGNGKIDYMENIYNDPEELIRGVWIGKYPKELVTNIYAISPQKPSNSKESAFLAWIITRGQDITAENGFCPLIPAERSSKLASLTEPVTRLINLESNYAASDKPMLVLFITALIILVAYFIVSRITGKENVSLYSIPEAERIFDEKNIDIRPGLFYDKTHTWAFMEPDGMVKIGIDDFLQHVTGPITGVKMKKAGERVLKGKTILSIIRDGKQLNLYSPVSGTIREFNNDLNINSEIINSSPYTEGWIYRIEPAKWLNEIEFLIIGNRYKEWIKSEFSRLKEFLSVSLNRESVDFSRVMQDGGEIKDGILGNMGPEVWEDFQINFIDQTR